MDANPTRILCRLFIHRWSLWKDYANVRLTWGGEHCGDAIGQERYCAGCGKRQQRLSKY